MNNFVLLNTLLSQFIHIHRLLNRRRKRKRILFLLMGFEKRIKLKIRATPRLWRFQRESSFMIDLSTWPLDVFQRMFRMSRALFMQIVTRLQHLLVKQNLTRETIPVKTRVAVALYTLKSGSNYSVIGDVFGISKSSVCRILDEFMDCFITAFLKDEIKFPDTLMDQHLISERFLMNYQFPDCVGALDGCHIPIITPESYGSDYYNYKNWHSIVLQALVDSDYRFLNVYIGQPGRVSDGGVFAASSLGRNLNNLIHEPFHVIADSAYPISEKLLKPYSGNNLMPESDHFNYRLSRARMVVECAFGRLKGRWRILLKRMDWQVPKINKCITTCCILHNLVEKYKEPFPMQLLEEVENHNGIYPQPNENPFADNRENVSRARGENKRNNLRQLLQTNYLLYEDSD